MGGERASSGGGRACAGKDPTHAGVTCGSLTQGKTQVGPRARRSRQITRRGGRASERACAISLCLLSLSGDVRARRATPTPRRSQGSRSLAGTHATAAMRKHEQPSDHRRKGSAYFRACTHIECVHVKTAVLSIVMTRPWPTRRWPFPRPAMAPHPAFGRARLNAQSPLNVGLRLAHAFVLSHHDPAGADSSLMS
jgi:hypothetical protein